MKGYAYPFDLPSLSLFMGVCVCACMHACVCYFCAATSLSMYNILPLPRPYPIFLEVVHLSTRAERELLVFYTPGRLNGYCHTLSTDMLVVILTNVEWLHVIFV